MKANEPIQYQTWPLKNLHLSNCTTNLPKTPHSKNFYSDTQKTFIVEVMMNHKSGFFGKSHVQMIYSQTYRPYLWSTSLSTTIVEATTIY